MVNWGNKIFWPHVQGIVGCTPTNVPLWEIGLYTVGGKPNRPLKRHDPNQHPSLTLWWVPSGSLLPPKAHMSTEGRQGCFFVVSEQCTWGC